MRNSNCLLRSKCFLLRAPRWEALHQLCRSGFARGAFLPEQNHALIFACPKPKSWQTGLDPTEPVTQPPPQPRDQPAYPGSSMPIHRIGIVGGGTAGYLAALYLKRTFPEMQVTVIESSRLPVIGVGESTTPLLIDFLHLKMGFPVDEFFRETRPTVKLGVRLDWGLPGDYHYNSTFGVSSPANALFHSGEINNLSFASMLMEARHAPVLATADGYCHVGPPADVGYHIDNRRFLAYLKRKLLALGCVWLDAEIAEVRATPGTAAIDRLVTTDGRELTYDLYLDCSGFASLLAGKALGAGWVSYSSSLMTDRAVIGMRPGTGEILPYTTASTLDHGWLWNTPMQAEDHLGYVFCSAYCTDEQARAELKQHCSTVNNERVIRFKTGRLSQSWIGNTVALGNAFAFIEPLESTAIHMILVQLGALTRALAQHANLPAQQGYNRATNRLWDHLRWFIAIHYRFNRQRDTPFWKMCREQVDVSGVQDYLDYFEQHGPLAYAPTHPLHARMNRDAVFTVFSFDGVLTGCGVNREFFLHPADWIDDKWPTNFALRDMLARQAMPHREALAVLEQGRCDILGGRASNS